MLQQALSGGADITGRSVTGTGCKLWQLKGRKDGSLRFLLINKSPSKDCGADVRLEGWQTRKYSDTRASAQYIFASAGLEERFRVYYSNSFFNFQGSGTKNAALPAPVTRYRWEWEGGRRGRRAPYASCEVRRVRGARAGEGRRVQGGASTCMLYAAAGWSSACPAPALPPLRRVLDGKGKLASGGYALHLPKGTLAALVVLPPATGAEQAAYDAKQAKGAWASAPALAPAAKAASVGGGGGKKDAGGSKQKRGGQSSSGVGGGGGSSKAGSKGGHA
jgi:hypothetical protein